MGCCVSIATMINRTHQTLISALPILLDDYICHNEEYYSYSYSHLQRCQCLDLQRRMVEYKTRRIVSNLGGESHYGIQLSEDAEENHKYS
jgi:hypothetical protein